MGGVNVGLLRGDVPFAAEDVSERALGSKVDPIAAEFAKKMPGRAAEWLEKNSCFEQTYSDAKLKRVSCPVLPFMYLAALTDDNYGLNFKREVVATDTVASLQEILDFMVLEHIGLPDFSDLPEGWRVFARPLDGPSFRDDADGQRIFIEDFDGATIRWRVENRKFGAVGWQGPGLTNASWGRALPDDTVVAKERHKGAANEVRGSFVGRLHFQCAIRLEA
eukprot:TRINITY_DN122425_c0_g1_i1.p1 TRINITY_DN122425_c0_g1~~TRINITY_DN122425_c0_g1_i1.p1  ORF type:complete len:221 (+),score=49.34 TRINITY_DN122425_c0_g1_i1:85-747(+)